MRSTAKRRATVGVAAVALGAGLVGGPWGVPVRAEIRTLVAGAATGAAAVGMVPTRAGEAGSEPSSPSPGSSTDRAQAAVAAAVTGLMAGRPADSVSIAAVDTTTGTRVSWGLNSGMTTASVFKLLLLEGYLLQNQDSDQAPGEGESEALTAMIESSDNDAANEVYGALDGRIGVSATLDRLGLSATVLGPDDQWGLSTTSAADQVTLLTDLVSPQSPLSSASRTYALGLMTNVESDQRWGVGAAADPASDPANKNGWLDVDDDGGRWVVNSVGVVQSGGHPVLLAVLTQHDADLADGTALVESLSQSVTTSLRDPATAASLEAVAGSQTHN
jgi:hypothetical protein